MSGKKVNGLLMAAFREAVFKFDAVSFYNTDDKRVFCELEYIKDKFVYVFTTDPRNKGKYRLASEYFGIGDGDFAKAVLDGHRGEDERPFSDAVKKHLIMPVVVEDNELEIYACLSRMQLPWKRIEEISKDPSKRCFRLGSPKGGLCWVPKCVERNIASLCGVNDERLTDPGNSTVMVGLYDHLREAERRAEQFRSKLDDYLQMRFDCNQIGETSEAQQRLQMKKYGAGLVLNLLQSNHPHVEKFKAALKNNGRDLEDYIREENKKEIRIRQEAEKTACSLARWIDDPDDVFEEVLADYTADEEQQMHWDYIQDFYCDLLNRFNELSITRKYVSDKWKNKDSWMQRYLLNADAFKSYRKVTTAVAQFMGVMSEVAYRTIDIKSTCKTVEAIYKVWFKDIVLEVFSDKRVKTKAYHLTTLLQGPEIDVVHKIRISKQCEPLEKLGKIADAKAMKRLLQSIEILNIIVAGISWYENRDKKGAKKIKELGSTIGSFIDIALVFSEKIFKRQPGITPLAFFGTISATIDTGVALYECTEEYEDKDYDAMVSKIVVATGAATVAVGSAMVTAAAFSAAMSTVSAGASLMAVAQTVFWYGAGLTASGVGSPAGGALIFIGAVAVAAGTVAYFFTNDSKTETWLKQSPWGPDEEWDFETGNLYGEKLDILHGLLYAFKAEVWFDPWKKRVGIRMKSAFFQAETKIVIKDMVLSGAGSTEKVVTEPVIIDENAGNPLMEIDIKTEQEIDLTATFPHNSTLKEVDTVEAKLQVDLFGNDNVILPERNKFVTCKAHVYG